MAGATRKKTTTRRATPAKKAKAPAKSRAATAKKATAAKATKKTAKKATKPTKVAKPKSPTQKKTATKKPAAKAKPAPKTVAAKPAAKATKPAKATKAAAPAPAKAATKAPKPMLVTKIPAARLPGPPVEGEPVKAAGKKGMVICELSGFEVAPSKPALSPKTLERLKEKLTEEKQRLLHQAEELAAEAEQLAVEREAGDTQFDEESGEGDTVNVERERDLLLSATARQVVEEIDEALARMKKGTYGVCKYAGRKLPIERLEAIPWANVCVDCKARADRRR